MDFLAWLRFAKKIQPMAQPHLAPLSHTVPSGTGWGGDDNNIFFDLIGALQSETFINDQQLLWFMTCFFTLENCNIIITFGPA